MSGILTKMGLKIVINISKNRNCYTNQNDLQLKKKDDPSSNLTDLTDYFKFIIIMFARSKSEKVVPTTRTRTKVHCFCRKCNGKLVDPRMKNTHIMKSAGNYSGNNNCQKAGPSITEPSDANDDNIMEYNQLHADDDNVMGYDLLYADDNVMEYNLLPEITDPLPEVIEPFSERNYVFLTKKMPIHEPANFQMVKKGKISDHVLGNLMLDNQDKDSEDFDDDGDQEDDDDDDGISEYSEDFDDQDECSEDESINSEDSRNDDNEEVNFASTEFDEDEANLPCININYDYAWIILWILQY